MSDAELAVVEAEAELAKARARGALAAWSFAQSEAISVTGSESEIVLKVNECEAACAAQDVVIAEARLKRARAIYDFSVKPDR